MRRPLLVWLVLALVLVGCSSGDEGPGDTEVFPGSTVETGSTAETGATGETGAEPERERLLSKDGDFVALPQERYLPMWEEPGKGRHPDFAFDTFNDYDESVPMLVEHATMRDGEPWYELLLPVRPNGSSAWARGRDLEIRQREDRLEVDLSKEELVHLRDGDVVDRYRVGIGTSQFPTTTGTFYVFIKVPYANPNQPYGIMALGLSGFSRVITDWPGGGRIAVHGTPYRSDRGKAVSHGCVRVYNGDMEDLTDLPLGTPVEITA